MIRIALFLTTSCLVALQGAEVDEWTEVPLNNSSFETGDAFPAGWELMKGNVPRPSHPSVIAWDKEFARTGMRSVYIRKEDAGPIRVRSTASLPVTLGNTYLLKIWIRTSAFGKYATATLTASSSTFGPNGKQWSVSKEYEGGSALNLEWQCLSLEFTPPECVQGFLISFANTTGVRDGTAIEFWFDDLSLQKKNIGAARSSEAANSSQ